MTDTTRLRRPQAEIEAAEEEVFDKRWYDRSQMLAVERENLAGAMARRRLEERYGKENLGPYNDFEWGFLAGKHAALRWVLDPGASWDDEGLGDT